jgi:hypothetical protein
MDTFAKIGIIFSALQFVLFTIIGLRVRSGTFYEINLFEDLIVLLLALLSIVVSVIFVLYWHYQNLEEKRADRLFSFSWQRGYLIDCDRCIRSIGTKQSGLLLSLESSSRDGFCLSVDYCCSCYIAEKEEALA